MGVRIKLDDKHDDDREGNSVRNHLLDVVVRTHDDIAEIEVSGEIDIANSPELHSDLRDVCAACARVAVDLRAVGFIDLSGMRALEALAEEARHGGIFVTVTNPAVDRVMEVSQSIPGE